MPNQHGAWAFVIVPVLVSAALTEPRLLHLVLLAGWVSAYCASFFAGRAVKVRSRPGAWRHYLPQLACYGLVAALCASRVPWELPRVVWVAPALIIAFAVNLGSIAGRRERAWLNDVAGIVASLAAGSAGYLIGGGSWRDAVTPSTILLLYFIGTVFYVKTMIRERGRTTVLRASVVWHVMSLGTAIWLAPPTAPVFALALVRAAVIPGRSASPKQVGLGETFITLLLVISTVWGLRSG